MNTNGAGRIVLYKDVTENIVAIDCLSLETKGEHFANKTVPGMFTCKSKTEIIMDDKVKIRPLDIKKEWEILDELLWDLHKSEKEMNPRTATWPVIRDRYFEYLDDCIKDNEGVVLVAEVEGKVAGFIFGYLDEPDGGDFGGGNGDDLYVSDGFVKPEFENMNVYGMLNEAFENHFKKFAVRRIYRYTLVENENMNKWLKKQGYDPIRIVYEKWLR